METVQNEPFAHRFGNVNIKILKVDILSVLKKRVSLNPQGGARTTPLAD